MEFEEIKAFIKAGYTKEEIEKMEHGTENETETGNATGEDSKPNDDNKESVSTENTNEVDDFNATIKALTDTVNGLSETVKAMQTHNAESAKGGKPEKDEFESVMQDFISNI